MTWIRAVVHVLIFNSLIWKAHFDKTLNTVKLISQSNWILWQQGSDFSLLSFIIVKKNHIPSIQHLEIRGTLKGFQGRQSRK